MIAIVYDNKANLVKLNGNMRRQAQLILFKE